jgi:hypothetical protein
MFYRVTNLITDRQLEPSPFLLITVSLKIRCNMDEVWSLEALLGQSRAQCFPVLK